jgi:hypothetical protein
VKYTLLSKWTVLILTLGTAAATIFGIRLTFGGGNVLGGVLLILVGLLVYAVAWIVALVDSIQERNLLWTIGLIVLVPFFVGPAVYGILGPKNTK